MKQKKMLALTFSQLKQIYGQEIPEIVEIADKSSTVEDFKAVIDKKVQEWGAEPKPGEKDMRPYIRPSTLFGTKFENYLQAPSAKQTRSVNNGFNNFQGRDYKDMSDLERKLIQ